MKKFIVLDASEREALFRQDPDSAKDGGFQGFWVRLQQQYREGTQEQLLTDRDLEDIPRYAFDYKQGGWEARLITVFARHLGPKLGR